MRLIRSDQGGESAAAATAAHPPATFPRALPVISPENPFTRSIANASWAEPVRNAPSVSGTSESKIPLQGANCHLFG